MDKGKLRPESEPQDLQDPQDPALRMVAQRPSRASLEMAQGCKLLAAGLEDWLSSVKEVTSDRTG